MLMGLRGSVNWNAPKPMLCWQLSFSPQDSGASLFCSAPALKLRSISSQEPRLAASVEALLVAAGVGHQLLASFPIRNLLRSEPGSVRLFCWALLHTIDLTNRRT